LPSGHSVVIAIHRRADAQIPLDIGGRFWFSVLIDQSWDFLHP
jgi:hypothetical protein